MSFNQEENMAKIKQKEKWQKFTASIMFLFLTSTVIVSFLLPYLMIADSVAIIIFASLLSLSIIFLVITILIGNSIMIDIDRGITEVYAKIASISSLKK